LDRTAATDASALLSSFEEYLGTYGAAFWLGSNAMIRRQALEDICEIDVEDGFPVKHAACRRTTRTLGEPIHG